MFFLFFFFKSEEEKKLKKATWLHHTIIRAVQVRMQHPPAWGRPRLLVGAAAVVGAAVVVVGAVSRQWRGGEGYLVIHDIG